MLSAIKLGMIIAIAASVFGAAIFLYEKGKSNERLAQREQNLDAAEAGNEASLSLYDCINAGGVYDFWSGKCSGTSSSGGK